MEIKVEILVEKMSESLNEPFWYYGEDIARVQFPNGKKLYAESRGELQVRFEENGTRFIGDNAVTEAINLGLTDKDILDLYENDLVILNNWFEIVLVDIEGNLIGDESGMATTYDEAIELLKEIGKEQIKLMYTEYGTNKSKNNIQQ